MLSGEASRNNTTASITRSCRPALGVSYVYKPCFSPRSSDCNGRTPSDRLRSLDQVDNEPFFCFDLK